MFNEENTVEQMVLDALSSGAPTESIAEERRSYAGDAGRWRFVPAGRLPRKHSDVLVEPMVRDALIRLNPEIGAAPDLADEVIYRLRAIFLSVRAEGLVRANELFAGWLRGERSMPFGERGEHTQVRLVDFDDPANNDYVVTSQWVYPSREAGSRFDVVLLVNGIPLVIGEVKTPVRPAVSWLDGAADIHDGYETSVPEMFVPNVFSFATEGRRYRYGSVGMPVDIWGPWHVGSVKGEVGSVKEEGSDLHHSSFTIQNKRGRSRTCDGRCAPCCGPGSFWTSCATSRCLPRTGSTGASR